MNNKYRIKGWYWLLNLIVVLVTLSGLLMLAGVITLLIVLVVFAFRNGEIQNVVPLGMFSGILVLFGALMTLAGVVFPSGNALFSYLGIGPAGIELRIWPFYRLRCPWHKIVGIEQVSVLWGLLCLPMLRYEDGQIETWPLPARGRKPDYAAGLHNGHHSSFQENPSGLPLFLVALLLWSVNDQKLIPIHIFSGWPKGRLSRDLEHRLGKSPVHRQSP